jgi:carbon-monoxide dehydrogenase medium subunit
MTTLTLTRRDAPARPVEGLSGLRIRSHHAAGTTATDAGLRPGAQMGHVMRMQALGHGLVAQSQRALPPFVLFRPQSLHELGCVLADHPGATFVAGSTDVFARIREGLTPHTVVGLRRVAKLGDVQLSGGELRLGATVTHFEGSSDSVVRETVPGLAAAWAEIATVRIRHTATLGGNLMARQARYELPVILGALDGQMEFLHGSTLPVRGLWDADLAASGCLVAATVRTVDLVWFGYDRSLRPLTTLALALRRTPTGLGVAATVGSEVSRPVTLTVERDVPHPGDLVGIGAELSTGLPEEIADHSGPVDYRRHVAAVQIDRLLARAAAESSATDPGEQRRGAR